MFCRGMTHQRSGCGSVRSVLLFRFIALTPAIYILKIPMGKVSNNRKILKYVVIFGDTVKLLLIICKPKEKIRQSIT